MKILYIDSSTLVSLVLENSPKILRTLQSYDRVVSSELSQVECQSGLSFQISKDLDIRTQAEQQLNQMFSRIDLFRITSEIIAVARGLVRSYRVSIGLRTLDALHLATAKELQRISSGSGTVEFLTSDKRQFAAFTAEGFVGHFV